MEVVILIQHQILITNVQGDMLYKNLFSNQILGLKGSIKAEYAVFVMPLQVKRDIHWKSGNSTSLLKHLALVVWRADSAIFQITCYPVITVTKMHRSNTKFNIQQIEIYPVDSIIHPGNNQSLMYWESIVTI